MRHEAACAALTEFLQGRLGGAASDEVAEHVTGCAECAAAAEAYETLRAIAPRRAGPPEAAHPTTGEIARYAATPESLCTDDLARVGAHLQECSRCAEEVKVTTQAHRLAHREPFLRRWARSPARPALRFGMLGAAAALLVLAWPAWLGFSRLPGVAAERDDLRASLGRSEERARQLERAEAWKGSIDLAVLAGPLRGQPRASMVRIAEGQPFVPIAVMLQELPEEGAADPVVFQIRSEVSGSAAWEVRLTAAQVRAEVRRSQVVTLLVAARAIPQGAYRLVVTEGSGVAFFEAPFEVVRPS